MQDLTDDLAWLSGARDRDPNALAAIFDGYAPALYKYALRLHGDSAEADAIVGDVFAELLEQLTEGKGPGENLRLYLYQIACHRVMDLATHSRRSNGLDGSLTAGPNGIPSSQNEGRELLAVLEAALHRDLSAEQRNILVLRLIEGFSSLETATITGQSVGNVEAIQSQAVAILRSIMSGKFQGNP